MATIKIRFSSRHASGGNRLDGPLAIAAVESEHPGGFWVFARGSVAWQEYDREVLKEMARDYILDVIPGAEIHEIKINFVD